MRAWVIAVAALLLAPASARAATTWSVSPAGGGDCHAAPCTLAMAVAGAGDGDTLQLASGDYPALGAVSIAHAVTLAGTGRPVLHVSALAFTVPGVTLRDVSVLGTTGSVLSLGSGTLERVSVGTETGAAPDAICSLAGPAVTVRDSACVGGHGDAVRLGHGSYDLRNLTAATASGAGIRVDTGDQATTGTIRNTIAIGSTYDIDVNGTLANFQVDHTRYALWRAASAGELIFGAGNTGATADSIFAALGQEERPGAPTIDAGTAVDPGETDLLGRPRSQGAAPDIGATEYQPDKPVPVAGDATDVGTNAAVVPGTVDPRGLSSTWTLEWGPTAAYGLSTPAVTIPGATLPLVVSVQLTGLDEDTTYHYRLVATNLLGTTFGADKSFTTFIHPAAPPPPGPGPGDVVGPVEKAPQPKVTIALPPANRCVTTLSFKPKIAKGGRITAVSVYVAGKRKLRVTGAKARRTIKLKLPRGTHTVEIRVTTKDGRTIKKRQRVRSCR